MDDGSTDDTQTVLQEMRLPYAPEVIIHVFPENKGKLAARNKGMELAEGEWICWLDSDDAYVPNYLATLAEAIRLNPAAEIFNFGAIVYQGDNQSPVRGSLRDTFLPELRPGGGGHVSFKSGRISSGQFVFKKALIAEQAIGFLPETRVAYGTDDSFAALAAQKWPGIGRLYGRREDGQWLPFGNPFGDDYAYFFALTREHESVPLMLPLYIQYLRP